MGRPPTLSEKQKKDVREDLSAGLSVSAIARKLATSRQTIMRIRDTLSAERP
ncbi:helix-turn-helix domain-containing protein [Allorhizobium ampelinum]|uniref:helix-turn-helix domain-containing protein n=1 Tax=Allorhizobium ampelinum TaxID=3025782 RepID=UPI002278D6C1|nr:helix-turn-helix domain-containing protein [Allorhizobium ampelinum]